MAAGNNGGGRREKLSVERVQTALQACGGLKTATAKTLGVSRSTLYRFIDGHPELNEVFEDAAETLKDLAEGQVVKAIKNGDMSTTRWYLDRMAKERGYGAVNVDVGNRGGQPLKVATTLPPDVLAKIPSDVLMEMRTAMLGDSGE